MFQNKSECTSRKIYNNNRAFFSIGVFSYMDLEPFRKISSKLKCSNYNSARDFQQKASIKLYVYTNRQLHNAVMLKNISNDDPNQQFGKIALKFLPLLAVNIKNQIDF